MTQATDLSAIPLRVVMVNGRKLLEPADVFAEEAVAKWKPGVQVLVNWRKPRSIQQHRLLFAILHVVTETSDMFADKETLLENLKQATGLVVTKFNPIRGFFYEVVESISFESMSQQRFNDWFVKAIEVLARDVLSIAPETLRNEVFAMLEDKRSRHRHGHDDQEEKAHDQAA